MTTTQATGTIQADIVELDGESLTVAKIVHVARGNAAVALSETARSRVASSRAVLDRMLEQREIIYGVNTGVGENVKYAIPPEKVNDLQENILRSLCCGTGEALPLDVTRGSMLLRANSLSKGYSAIRPVVLQCLVDVLNAGIVPHVPRYGSLGASGDLIPSAYIARALLGQGTVRYAGRDMNAAEALQAASVTPVPDLRAKEGLALVNGTSSMTSLAALNYADTSYLTSVCLGAVALAVEVLHAARDPFEETIHRLKNHPGQLAAAQLLARLTESSGMTVDLESSRERLKETRYETSESASELDMAIQDGYSLRCAPQGFGPIIDGLRSVREAIECEANSVNDNPLIDPQRGRVYHTGNFYGGHMARAMDQIKLDLVTMANWLHSLMALLVDPRFSRGLPASLAVSPGLHNGFKNMQLSLSSLVVACRQMSGASLIHTLPTEQYNQDVVSLGMHAATTAMDMVTLLHDAASITLLALCQAVDLRGEQHGREARLGTGTRHIYDTIRSRVSFAEVDRPMEEDIRQVSGLIRERAFDIA